MITKITKDTQEKILEVTTSLVALHGCSGVSMRLVAKKVPVVQSVIYHYYKDKDTLLKAMYDRANRLLGIQRATLPQPKSVSKRLELLIQFQIEHAELIIAVLKYYLHYREDFAQQGSGTLPEKSTLHVEEILDYGQQTNQLYIDNLESHSKVVAHAINGYLLEYYPHMPTGKTAKSLIREIVNFTLKALSPKK